MGGEGLQGRADAGDGVGPRGVADGEHGGKGATHGIRPVRHGGVDEGDDRACGVAVGGGVEEGGGDGRGGVQTGAHGLGEVVAGAERVGDQERAGERVVAAGREPGSAPDQPRHRNIVELGAQVAAPATV